MYHIYVSLLLVRCIHFTMKFMQTRCQVIPKSFVQEEPAPNPSQTTKWGCASSGTHKAHIYLIVAHIFLIIHPIITRFNAKSNNPITQEDRPARFVAHKAVPAEKGGP